MNKANLLSLMIVLLDTFTSYAAGEIVITEKESNIEEQNSQQPIFGAEVLPDNSILVSSSESNNFYIEITDMQGGNIAYQGTSTNSSQHITDTLDKGQYIITITTNNCKYSGEFNISNE